jgi:hypothetical protein
MLSKNDITLTTLIIMSVTVSITVDQHEHVCVRFKIKEDRSEVLQMYPYREREGGIARI